MILCISVLCCDFLIFISILLMWFFSLFFLMSLAAGLSILFIFSKNQLLSLLIFAIVSFVYFCFYSHYFGRWVIEDPAVVYVRECFIYVVFSFSFVSVHILISFLICWLFRSVLFSLHMFVFLIVFFFPVQFSQFSYSVMSNSLWPHELQHTRPPCPSPTPGVHSDSRPSSQWCHPAISSSVVPFSSCP